MPATAERTLPPNWLSKVFDDVEISIMERTYPDEPAVYDAQQMKRGMTDAQKHRLFTRFEARFKAWAGESFAAFAIRTGGDENA